MPIENGGRERRDNRAGDKLICRNTVCRPPIFGIVQSLDLLGLKQVAKSSRSTTNALHAKDPVVY